jgi:two-component system nitrogen regulation sensor histidine kinase NtrY
MFAREGVDESVRECAAMIVEHVDSIKRLANEFSNFARMPTAQLRPGDLNATIADVLDSYAENHPEVTFQFIADDRLPEIKFDPEQLRRLLMNLIDNAVAAIAGAGVERGKVVLKTSYDRRKKSVFFEVADNGPGIKHGDKARIFEPYFTTKEKGTGLGLAVVTSVVSDHQGKIRVYDNSPRGAKFVVELSASPQPSTQRPFAKEE